jgi:hypothetical protein
VVLLAFILACGISGTGFGIVLSAAIGPSIVSIIPAFACLSALHLYSNYQSLRALPLSTLNEQRFDLILTHFLHSLQHSTTPHSPRSVSGFAVFD